MWVNKKVKFDKDFERFEGFFVSVRIREQCLKGCVKRLC